MCFQLGSKMLGTTNDEDATKGQAYFDVFALADLQALAVKQVETEEAKPKNGKRFRVEHTTNQLSKTPKSFTSNSPKEQRMSAYLADVSAAFTELYRHRRPLYLEPLNECGMPKFVCTTVRFQHALNVSYHQSKAEVHCNTTPQPAWQQPKCHDCYS
jgi:hypothetical protein